MTPSDSLPDDHNMEGIDQMERCFDCVHAIAFIALCIMGSILVYLNKINEMKDKCNQFGKGI